MNRLTHKQRAFVENFVNGSNYSQAYRDSYNCGRAKPSTIRTHASRLANSPKILAAIEGLETINRERNQSASISRHESLRYDLLHGSSSQARIGAAKKLAREMRLL